MTKKKRSFFLVIYFVQIYFILNEKQSIFNLFISLYYRQINVVFQEVAIIIIY